uniref:Uncharacterized protein n=1 Tax=Echeneis naucrates TaxID=173247 RepID=A0A665TW08_ECHNA
MSHFCLSVGSGCFVFADRQLLCQPESNRSLYVQIAKNTLFCLSQLVSYFFQIGGKRERRHVNDPFQEAKASKWLWASCPTAYMLPFTAEEGRGRQASGH